MGLELEKVQSYFFKKIEANYHSFFFVLLF
jgi:hypothetical protein